ncbi:calcium-transporting ATPase 8, plasma membrane-type-like protein [Tanacetum coccineum]
MYMYSNRKTMFEIELTYSKTPTGNTWRLLLSVADAPMNAPVTSPEPVPGVSTMFSGTPVIGSAIEVLPQYDIGCTPFPSSWTNIPVGSLKAPQSATPTGHYDVKGLTEKLKTNPKKGIPKDESNILNTKNMFRSNTYPQKKGRSLGYFLIRFLLDAYWDTTLVILMVATAASLALGIKFDKGNLYFCFPYLTVQANTHVHDGRGHTALTSECSFMLEEVLAITRGLHDVRKEASALHSSLMGDLSNASSIVLLPEYSASAPGSKIADDNKRLSLRFSAAHLLLCTYMAKGVYCSKRRAFAALRREAWPPRYEMDQGVYSRRGVFHKDSIPGSSSGVGGSGMNVIDQDDQYKLGEESLNLALEKEAREARAKQEWLEKCRQEQELDEEHDRQLLGLYV